MILDLDRQQFGRSELAISGSLELGLSADRPQVAQVAGNLVVRNLESRVLLSGCLQAESRAECGRCLEEFTIHWDFPVDVIVLRDIDSDESEGETLLITQRTGEVDLRESIRECAVLGYPQSLLCKSDCLGLCPECGIDRNQATCECSKNEVDPRWEGLP